MNNILSIPLANARRFGPWLVGFLLLSALGLSAMEWSNVSGPDWVLSFWASAYLALMMPTYFFLILGLACLPLFVVRLLSGRHIALQWAAIVIVALAFATIALDLKVYQLYRFHLNGMVWNLFTGGSLTDILSFSTGTWLRIALAAVVLFSFCLLLALASKWLIAGSQMPQSSTLIAAMWVVFLVANGIHAVADAKGDSAVTSSARYVPWAIRFTATRLLARLGLDVANSSRLSFRADTAGLHYPRAPLRYAHPSGQNILILVVDSLRADMLNAQVMPHSFGLAQSSTMYLDHLSTGNATRYGIFGLLYGLPGSYWPTMLAQRRGSALFDALVEQHYQLYLHGSAPLTSPEFDRTVFARVTEQISPPNSSNNSAENDQHIAEAFISQLRSRQSEKPFFGFLFFDAPHAFALPENAVSPFQPMLETVDYMALNQNYDPTPFVNRYRASVYFVDKLIGDVLIALEKSGYGDNTVVIITGDHAQEFNDLGLNYWGHNGNFADAQVHVPMLLHRPGQAPGLVAKLTSHEDVVPTLMQTVLGVENPVSDYSTGLSLSEPAHPERVLLLEQWTQRAIRANKQIYSFDDFGAMQILDERYRQLPQAKADRRVIATAMQQMSQFQQ